jgi:hypothetical protein
MVVMFLGLPLAGRADTPVMEAWAARYPGDSSEPEDARAMAVDNSGNVYVTGYIVGNGTNMDYVTVKYDKMGKLLWVACYNGPGNGPDEATSLAVDTSGNVYVTGSSYGGATGRDFATVKYDSSGSQVWVARYDAKGGAEAIAIDDSGNVYVTGTTATIKYDNAGNQLWDSSYSGNLATFEPVGLAVDKSGNLCVFGMQNGNTALDQSGNYYFIDQDRPQPPYGNIYSGQYYTVVKYDSAGNQLWRAHYAGISGEWQPTDMTIDRDGNVYLTGWGMSYLVDTPYDYATAKFDYNGKLIWAKHYDGSAHSIDQSSGIAVDELGNVYVTGEAAFVSALGGNVTEWNYATIKYDSAGNQLWMARYNGQASGYSKPSDIALDTRGNAYVTGYSSGSNTGYDWATIKYDTAGNQLWVARYNGPGYESDYANDIVVDDSGNIYVAGNSMGQGSHGDYTTIKYIQPGKTVPKLYFIGPALVGLGVIGVYSGYVWRRRKQDLWLQRNKQKLEQWGQEGYDVSEFKSRWFE